MRVLVEIPNDNGSRADGRCPVSFVETFEPDRRAALRHREAGGLRRVETRWEGFASDRGGDRGGSSLCAEGGEGGNSGAGRCVRLRMMTSVSRLEWVRIQGRDCIIDKFVGLC